MSHRERMSSVDTTWLRMDRPQNLMIIIGVWVVEGPVALDRLENQLAERMLTYRRYRQKIEIAAAGVYWVTTRISTSPTTSSGCGCRDAAAKRRSSASSATSPPSRSISTIPSGRCTLARTNETAFWYA
jgi:hypothetical protein